MANQIIVAMDMDIPEGMRLISKTRDSEQIYGYKIGSLWILDRGVDILKSVIDILDEIESDHKIILDMQKWGTDIPDIIKKQVERVAPYVNELICCPMGAGSDSLKTFADTCHSNKITPISVTKMTHANSNKYLTIGYEDLIFDDAYKCNVRKFVIPATKDITSGSYEHLLNTMNFYPNIEKYATGFKVQGGQVKPMIDVGVTKFIVGRAIYEAENPIETIENIYKEINGG